VAPLVAVVNSMLTLMEMVSMIVWINVRQTLTRCRRVSVEVESPIETLTTMECLIATTIVQAAVTSIMVNATALMLKLMLTTMANQTVKILVSLILPRCILEYVDVVFLTPIQIWMGNRIASTLAPMILEK
jgi:hypothetical protein